MAAENTGLDMVSTLTSHRGSREERHFHCYFYCLFCSVLGITEEPKRVFCHSHHLIIALVCLGLIYVSSDSSHTLFSCKRVLLKQDANEFFFFLGLSHSILYSKDGMQAEFTSKGNHEGNIKI